MPARPAQPEATPARPAQPEATPAQPAQPEATPAQPAQPEATPAQPAQPEATPAQPEAGDDSTGGTSTTASLGGTEPVGIPATESLRTSERFMTMTVNVGCHTKASKRPPTASPHPNRHQRTPHTPAQPARRACVPCPTTDTGSPACAAPLILLSGRKHLRAPLAQLARTARRQHPARRDGDGPGDSANVCGHSTSDNSRLARRVPWGPSAARASRRHQAPT